MVSRRKAPFSFSSTYGGLFIIFVMFATVSLVYADLDALTIRFAGGCVETNSTGACTIRATGTGTDIDGEQVKLTSSDTRRGRFRDLSRRTKSISDGRATFRFRNLPGKCFKAAVSGSNVRSNVICEGSGGSSSSASSNSSSSSSSSQSSSSSSSSSSDDDHGGRG